jgi:hypothetical protein
VVEIQDTDQHTPIGMQVIDNAFLGVSIFSLYLHILTNLQTTLNIDLSLLSVDVLQHILHNIEGVIRLHEYTFMYYTHYLNI